MMTALSGRISSALLLAFLAGGWLTFPSVSAGAVPTAETPTAQTATLDLRTHNSNGVYLKLTSIAIADDYITVGLEATNGSDWQISLNDMVGEMHSVMILQDNLGNVYYLVPPDDNTFVEIPEAATLKQQFVFAGQLDPQATSLTLVTNSTRDPNNTLITDPVLAISNIPIPR